MTCDAIQMRTKNLKSMIKIAVNFNIMLSVSDAKIIRVDSNFYDFKIQISAWIFTNYFSDFLPIHNDFLTSIFVSKIVLKSIYFYRYSKKFFCKFSALFWIKGLREIFPNKCVSGGQFWKKCPTRYHACYSWVRPCGRTFIFLRFHSQKFFISANLEHCIFLFFWYSRLSL